jgi:hypothetical protein
LTSDLRLSYSVQLDTRRIAVQRFVFVPPCDHGPMNLTNMLAELKAEREGIDQAILVLSNAAETSRPR